MKLRKLKLTNDARVLVEYLTERAHGGEDQHGIASLDPPRPELHSALAQLVPHVLRICELPVEYGDELAVTGVSCSYGETGEGVTITARRALQRCTAPLVLNTPHVLLDDWAELGACMRVLAAEAERYVQGERAQGELPFEEQVGEAIEAAGAEIAGMNVQLTKAN